MDQKYFTGAWLFKTDVVSDCCSPAPRIALSPYFAILRFMNRQSQVAFSLLELLVAMAIIAILIAVAYPNYIDYEAHAERNRAEAALLQLSSRMENYFSDNNKYEGADADALGIANLENDLSYQLSVVDASDMHFTIQAAPIDAQATRDSECGTLTLTDTNAREVSGEGNSDACWR